MKLLAAFFVYWTGAAAAGTSVYEICMTDEMEARATTRFAERFPHEQCTPFSTCPFKLRQTVWAIVHRDCREEAVAACENAECLMALRDRWTDAAEQTRAAIDDGLAGVDLTSLPRLQRRRLEDPNRWFSPVNCRDDADTCAATAAGQKLGDLRRILSEIGQLR